MRGLRRVASLSSVAGLLVVWAALPLLAQQAPPKPPDKKPQARKVWTNDDIPALQQSRGVSVVGTAPAPAETEKPAAAQPAAQPAPAGGPQQPKTYEEMSLEERQQWITQLEQEIAESEQELFEVRGKRLAAHSAEEEAQLREGAAKLEQAIEENRAEIETIRNLPPPKPPKPAKKAKPKTPAQPAAPAATPPSS